MFRLYTFAILVAAVAAETFEAPDVFNISNPVVGATLEHYVVSSEPSSVTKFVCSNIGSRCTYNRLFYESIDHGTGLEFETTEGPVWASINETSVFTLGPCTGDDNTATSRDSSTVVEIENNNCVVTCNANCTCAYITDASMNDPQLCSQVASRAPTPSPKTDPPVSQVCPQQQFATEFCPTLMNPNTIPDGTIDNYDCFNFCGGVWIDTCDIATGTCGATKCENATATGTLNGVVKGCTKEHYNANLPTGDNQNSNETTSSARPTQLFGSMGLAMMFIGVWSMSNW